MFRTSDAQSMCYHNFHNLLLTLLSPSYFEVYQAQGGHIVSPFQNFYIFRPIAMIFGTDVK